MARIDEDRWTQNPDGSWTRERLLAEGYVEYDDDTVAFATDTAVEAAQELGVDLSAVEGTGKDGKITKADVVAAAAN